ncbi:hypothetical protein [Flavihumibacter profundi]|uniref:hypothetical protein n=1 Tax=Flavihumibacter profundi TaxID=2716883 RepID=UPI001CC822DC|nr:hypothetical protein [Flavihumibacter profundi]MBZ5858060.1 hypothetical protein [Flavihumibacter profundi]
MRNIVPILLFTVIAVFSCKQANKQAGTKPEEQTYFPVNAYIESQLHKIDSLQLPVTRYFTSEGHGDTTLLSTAECRKLAAPFLEQDISDPALKNHYVENSFADQSIPSVSFTYQTKDSSLPLKRVDIVLKPDPVNADKVKSVYMEKLFQQGDSMVNEKLFWKNDHYFQVIRFKQVAKNQPVLSQLKVVWDPTE